MRYNEQYKDIKNFDNNELFKQKKVKPDHVIT